MKIRKKLLLGLTFSALLFMGIEYVSYMTAGNYRAKQYRSLSSTLPAMITLHEAESRLTSCMVHLMRWTQSRGTPPLLRCANGSDEPGICLPACEKTINGLLEEYATLSMRQTAKAQTRFLQQELSSVLQSAQRLASLRLNNQSTQAIQSEMNRLQQALLQTQRRLGLLQDQEYTAIRGQMSSAATITESLALMDGAMGFSAIGFIYLVAMIFAERFTKILGKASDAALAVADGDLSQRLPSRGSDEITTLARSFNRMVEAMEKQRDEVRAEVEVRKRAEQHAREAAQAKSEFLASMSHEFRTPLNGILGYTQILLMDKTLPEKTRQAVSSMRHSGENLLELINDVLDLSKIEASRMTIQVSHFYLRDLIDSIREVYTGQARMKGIEFRTVLDADLPENVAGDEGRIRQILVNLISNAVKFTDAGFVELRVSMTSPTQIHFSVRDTGIGIEGSQLDAITKPFHQVGDRDRKAQGTGLGLSISARLLQMMESELRIESSPGKGSRFWFELAHTPQQERKMVLSPEEVIGYEGRKRSILLVDDSRENRAVLLPLLRKTGFDVLEASNGAAAISDCLRVAPDLILMDYHMPGMNGADTTRSIREVFDRNMTPPPPVIMITGAGSAREREDSEKAGCVELAVKPIRFAELLRLLQQHLNLEWRYQHTVPSAPSEESATPAQRDTIVTTSQQEEEDLRPPPSAKLEQLLELARAGNIRPLRSALEDLGHEQDYNAFTRHLLALCKTYQVNRIVEFLEEQLQSASPPQQEQEPNHD